MRQPQLSTQFINLAIEQGNDWPWDDSVDLSISNSIYGVGLCGTLEYKVEIFNSNLNRWEDTNLVTLSLNAQSGGIDRLFFAPQLSDAIGEYTLRLKARMADYPLIVASENFQVEILECQTNLIATGGPLVDQAINWYSSDSYSIGGLIDFI
jgi:hypothetical protein